jgi:hypothetical protein
MVGIHAGAARNERVEKKKRRCMLLSTQNENGIPQAIWTGSTWRKKIEKKTTIRYSIKKFISSTCPKLD